MTQKPHHTPTIPDSVIEKIVAHRPQLAVVADNVRSGLVPERTLARLYLVGESKLTVSETIRLAKVAEGQVWSSMSDE